MRIIKSLSGAQSLLAKAKSQNKKTGLVPTMGALHQGHLSLIRKCRKENDVTVVSIFVNPAQFGPTEDYRTYPRDIKKDISLAKKENVDIIFYPSADDIYPDRYLTYIDVEDITASLCGKFRPGHFKGVTTIIAKLLNIICPGTLYLGQKDAQQNVVLKQMVRDLNFPVAVKILPTIREPDGLAMSSRNKYLSRQERCEAGALYQSLRLAKRKIQHGTRAARIIKELIRTEIKKNTTGAIQYIACVDADTLKPLNTTRGKVLIALAVRFRKATVIDNIAFRVR